jgi:hypothetical protein
MLSDSYTLTLEDDRLVQRFALATLWYSMHAEIWWAADDGWLESSVLECD